MRRRRWNPPPGQPSLFEAVPPAERERDCPGLFPRPPRLDELKRFAAPRNDDEALFNLQYAYFAATPGRRRDAALAALYLRLVVVAVKMVRHEVRSKSLRFTPEMVREKAEDAAAYFVEAYRMDEDFYLARSYTGYLYKRVRHEMYEDAEKERALYSASVDELAEVSADGFTGGGGILLRL